MKEASRKAGCVLKQWKLSLDSWTNPITSLSVHCLDYTQPLVNSAADDRFLSKGKYLYLVQEKAGCVLKQWKLSLDSWTNPITSLSVHCLDYTQPLVNSAADDRFLSKGKYLYLVQEKAGCVLKQWKLSLDSWTNPMTTLSEHCLDYTQPLVNSAGDDRFLSKGKYLYLVQEKAGCVLKQWKLSLDSWTNPITSLSVHCLDYTQPLVNSAADDRFLSKGKYLYLVQEKAGCVLKQRKLSFDSWTNPITTLCVHCLDYTQPLVNSAGDDRFLSKGKYLYLVQEKAGCVLKQRKLSLDSWTNPITSLSEHCLDYTQPLVNSAADDRFLSKGKYLYLVQEKAGCVLKQRKLSFDSWTNPITTLCVHCLDYTQPLVNSAGDDRFLSKRKYLYLVQEKAGCVLKQWKLSLDSWTNPITSLSEHCLDYTQPLVNSATDDRFLSKGKYLYLVQEKAGCVLKQWKLSLDYWTNPMTTLSLHCLHNTQPLVNSAADDRFLYKGKYLYLVQEKAGCVLKQRKLSFDSWTNPITTLCVHCLDYTQPLVNSAGDDRFLSKGKYLYLVQEKAGCVLKQWKLSLDSWTNPITSLSVHCLDYTQPLVNSAADDRFLSKGKYLYLVQEKAGCVLKQWKLSLDSWTNPITSLSVHCLDYTQPLVNSAGDDRFLYKGKYLYLVQEKAGCVLKQWKLSLDSWTNPMTTLSVHCLDYTQPLVNSAADDRFLYKGKYLYLFQEKAGCVLKQWKLSLDSWTNPITSLSVHCLDYTQPLWKLSLDFWTNPITSLSVHCLHNTQPLVNSAADDRFLSKGKYIYLVQEKAGCVLKQRKLSLDSWTNPITTLFVHCLDYTQPLVNSATDDRFLSKGKYLYLVQEKAGCVLKQWKLSLDSWTNPITTLSVHCLDYTQPLVNSATDDRFLSKGKYLYLVHEKAGCVLKQWKLSLDSWTNPITSLPVHCLDYTQPLVNSAADDRFLSKGKYLYLVQEKAGCVLKQWKLSLDSWTNPITSLSVHCLDYTQPLVNSAADDRFLSKGKYLYLVQEKAGCVLKQWKLSLDSWTNPITTLSVHCLDYTQPLVNSATDDRFLSKGKYLYLVQEKAGCVLKQWKLSLDSWTNPITSLSVHCLDYTQPLVNSAGDDRFLSKGKYLYLVQEKAGCVLKQWKLSLDSWTNPITSLSVHCLDYTQPLVNSAGDDRFLYKGKYLYLVQEKAGCVLKQWKLSLDSWTNPMTTLSEHCLDYTQPLVNSAADDRFLSKGKYLYLVQEKAGCVLKQWKLFPRLLD
ncbi:hypothetical protein J6590_080961 [Homalodisca vitripennis]|nr:hypothetical protein J6590_080961 [Homalodisca vitripennis]